MGYWHHTVVCPSVCPSVCIVIEIIIGVRSAISKQQLQFLLKRWAYIWYLSDLLSVYVPELNKRKERIAFLIIAVFVVTLYSDRILYSCSRAV